MFPRNANFIVKLRYNKFIQGNKEYALYVILGKGDPWVVHTWIKKPTEKEVNEIIEIVCRSFEIYHNSIRIPDYNVKVDSIIIDAE